MSKVKKFLKYTYPFKRYSVLKVQFSAILLLKIAQNGGKFKFKNAISFEWIGIFQNFFTLTSLWWFLSETIIRYPIILKKKFGGNFVTSFSRKNAKMWKTKNIRFFGMASSIGLQNFKWIALKLKKMDKGRRRFWCHICLPWKFESRVFSSFYAA